MILVIGGIFNNIVNELPKSAKKYSLTLERPTIKYSIVDQAGLAGPLSIFTHKITYLFNISKWILLRMLYDQYKYNSLLVKINKLIISSNQCNLFQK